MAKKLPGYLRGPFVAGRYDRREGIIYLKRTDGEWVSTRAYPAFFIKKELKPKLPVDAFERLILEFIEEGDYVRAVLDPTIRRDKLSELIEICESEGVPLLEADVSPVRRWLSDTGASVSQKFRALFFDLETHPLKIGFDDAAKKEHRIVSFAAYDQEGNSWFSAAKKSSDEEEVKLINEFVKIASKYDVLLAWNGDAYDFFVIKERAKKHKLHVDWYQWNLLDYMQVVKKVLMSIPDPDFKRSFSLDAVGENVLNIRKIKLPVGGGKIWTLLDTPSNRKMLEEYNRRDVEIMLGIEVKREFLTLHSALCSLCRTFPGHASIFPNELADGILLRLAVCENTHFPTRKSFTSEDDSKYEGAYVMDPVLGFHTDIQVPDFASLYPSIILAWNMSNETRFRDGDELTREALQNSAYASATGVRFRTDIDGLIPKALRQLISKRNEYKERAKQLPVESEEYKNVGHLSTAVKVATNSFYGLLGNEGSRYYDRDIARSVTLTGQLLIRETIKFFEEQGFKTVAADTDSTFVKCSSSEMKGQLELLNGEFIPRLLDLYGCKEHAVRMDFDKGYKSLLIVTKKRYAGKLALWKGRPTPDDMSPEIKGLETQRSDQIRYAQGLMLEFINLLLDPNADPSTIDDRLRMEGEKFFSITPDRDMIEITESVSKHPRDYSPKTTVVRIAEQMIAEGEEFFVGMKIPYIVIDHKPNVEGVHADKYTGKFDKTYYWQKRILPPILRLVNARFPSYTFGDFNEPRQRRLNFSIQKDRQVSKVRRVRVEKNEEATHTSRCKRITIKLKESDGVSAVKGIAALARSMPGKYKIRLEITIGNEIQIVDTQQLVSADCLREVTKLFPSVSITPKLL